MLRQVQRPVLYAQAATAYALLGRRAEALKVLKRAGEPSGAQLPFARAYFALGDRERGFALLTTAFDERQFMTWDAVRDDARFRALLGRLGLPETAGGGK